MSPSLTGFRKRRIGACARRIRGFGVFLVLVSFTKVFCLGHGKGMKTGLRGCGTGIAMMMTMPCKRPVIPLILATIAGLVGFGGEFFGKPSLLDTSAFLPDPAGCVLTGLAKIFFVLLTLFFVVSLCFGKHLRGRHY